MGLILLICSGGILIILAAYMIISRMINNRWLKQPPDEGKFLDNSGKKLFYRTRGKGDPAVIILHNSGSSSMDGGQFRTRYRMPGLSVLKDQVMAGARGARLPESPRIFPISLTP